MRKLTKLKILAKSTLGTDQLLLVEILRNSSVKAIKSVLKEEAPYSPRDLLNNTGIYGHYEKDEIIILLGRVSIVWMTKESFIDEGYNYYEDYKKLE